MRGNLATSALLALSVPSGMVRTAWAEEAAPPPPSDAPSVATRVADERARQRYQLSLGVEMREQLGSIGTGQLGGVGVGGAGLGGAGLGGLGRAHPTPTVGFEVRLGGPAWLMLQADGSAAAQEGQGATSSAWSAGAAVGLRLEEPVFDFVSVGGHGVVRGDLARSTYEGPGGGGTVARGEADSFAVGAAFGAGLHLRPTSFFGIRLALEVLRLGYRRSSESFSDETASGAFGQLTAAPRIELTFTL